jgi:signal transduction histidine kinase
MTEVEEFRKILGPPADPTLVRGHRKKLRGRPASRLAIPSEKTPPAKPGAKASAGFVRSADGNAAAFARIIEAGKQLSLLAGLDDLYPNIAGQAMALLNADAAHLFLPRDSALEIAGAAGLRELRGKRVPMQGSLAGWVARMGETMALPDIEKAAASWEKEYFKSVGLRAHLFLPVDWAGSRLAVLGLHGRKERHWTAREIALLNTFADFVAVALENARLYGEAEDRAKTLAELNRELAEALHVKTRFLATVSHELRSPLFVITGYASLITEQMFGPLPPGIADAAAKIIKQSDTLVDLITLILEISQLDAGTFACHPSSFDLKALLDEIARQARRLVVDKPIAFEARYSSEPLPILTDRERLLHILGHLLDNAAKFTQEGKIVLGAAPAQGGIEIVVEDSGIGIDPEHQKIIFEDFRQIEQEANRAYEGMGLGLYFSRRVIELLGGKISVDSELGKGSRFHLWLPDGASDQPAQEQI